MEPPLHHVESMEINRIARVYWIAEVDENVPFYLGGEVQLLKRRITLSNGLIAIQQLSVNQTYCTVHRIKTCPLDSVSHPSKKLFIYVTSFCKSLLIS